MSVALLRLIPLLAACGGLFLLWRAVARFPKPLGLIVTAGFVVRAIAAQILFWISYMEWPFLERLQLGSGFWFFASDGLEYFRKAVEAAGSGPMTILQYTRTAPSVAYVQALATSVYLFGTSPFVGILLNLACYLATCLIVLRWSSLAPKSATPAAIAIAAISLSPSSILWAVQPLKDAFFIFLTVAFVGACVGWQRAWRGASGMVRTAIASAVGMMVFLYGLAAVRWYFAMVVLAACGLFLVLVAIVAPGRRRLGAIAATAVLVLLLPRTLLLGGGPYVPPAIRSVLTPSTFFTSSKALPKSLTTNINDLRGGFERTGGATTIALGSNFEKVEKAAGTALEVQVPTPRALPNARRKKSRPRPVRETEQRTAQQEEEIRTADASDLTDEASAEQTADQAVSGSAASGPGSQTAPVSHASGESTHAQPKPAAGTPSTHAPVMTSASSAPASSRPSQPAPSAQSHPATTHPTDHASASKPQTPPASQSAASKSHTPPVAPHAVASKPQTPPAAAASTPTTPPKSAGAEVQTTDQPKQSPAQQAQQEAASKREAATKPAEPVRRASSQPSRTRKTVEPAPTKAAPVTPAPAPEPAVAVVQPPPVVAPVPPPVVTTTTESSASEGSSESQAMILPQSIGGRMVAGTVAVVMPRSIAQKLGLLKMSGGRGLWLLADLDTLAFDALLIATFVMLIRRRRGLLPTNPVSWLVLGATVMITVPLVYTVSNFGTLFRLREMIFIGVALVPLALSTLAVESEKILAREAEPVDGGDALPVAPETT